MEEELQGDEDARCQVRADEGGDGGEEGGEDEEEFTRGIYVLVKRKHTIFVDTEEEAKKFNAAEHFDTEPESDRTFNRPRRSQLEDEDAVVGLQSDNGTEPSGDAVKARDFHEEARTYVHGAYKTYTAYDEREKAWRYER